MEIERPVPSMTKRKQFVVPKKKRKQFGCTLLVRFLKHLSLHFYCYHMKYE